MKRRVLLVGPILLCLLAAAAAPPGATPFLMCRVSGTPMAPAFPGESDGRACCAVAPVFGPDGAVTGWTLTSPGCCALRLTPGRPEPPVRTATHGAPGVAIAWAPAPVLWCPPPAERVAAPVSAVEPPPLRGPPGGRPAPRAPPFFF
jgi:hypothetical protein